MELSHHCNLEWSHIPTLDYHTLRKTLCQNPTFWEIRRFAFKQNTMCQFNTEISDESGWQNVLRKVKGFGVSLNDRLAEEQ